MRRKDIFFTVILSLAGFGIAHFYLGDRKRGRILLIAHLALCIGIAFSMFVSKALPQGLYFVYLGLIAWGMYDAVKTAKLINESIQ